MSEEYPFTGLPSIDGEVVRPLKELLGDSFAELVNDFISSFPPKLNELKTASNTNDISSMMQISHTLKSSSGSFGFTRLFKRLEHLELQARKNNIVDHPNQVKLINEEFQSVIKEMNKN
ncbi:MAG: Hpt domain-containing protein [Sulfuriflexus sp.]|nr:Hpt domain-containing protein [Sulfuriflexus sp.]